MVKIQIFFLRYPGFKQVLDLATKSHAMYHKEIWYLPGKNARFDQPSAKKHNQRNLVIVNKVRWSQKSA